MTTPRSESSTTAASKKIGLSAEGLRVLTARQGLPEGDVVLVYLASGPTRVVLA
jgi:hypothetical protein